MEQFVEIDRRLNVEQNQSKFGGRIAEFVTARGIVGLPEIGPTGIVKDPAIDETKLPIIMTAVFTKSTPLHYSSDEVAVHGIVA